MKKVILTVKETKRDNNAGPKAKIDIEHFLTVDNFEKWDFVINQKSILQKIKVAYWEIPRFLSRQNDVDKIFLQYPTYSKIVTKQLMRKISHIQAKLILVVHDIESLRLHFAEQRYIQEELGMFNMADGLIVHNDKMQKWLKHNGVNVPMESLDVFDYDNKNPLVKNDKYSCSVCFAGNLNKAQFLSDISLKKAKLNVFGPNPLESYGSNILYQGQYSPDELPKHLKANFGLVWDGTTPSTCNGVFGNYMKYNNPHKASLYLSSGIPVLIWRQAALADFIEKEKVGVVIDNLNDLDNALANISENEYRNLLINTREIAQKLRAGFYIKRAVQKLEDKVG